MFQKTDAGDKEFFINHNCSVTEGSVTDSLYCSRLGGSYKGETSGCECRDWKNMLQNRRCP